MRLIGRLIIVFLSVSICAAQDTPPPRPQTDKTHAEIQQRLLKQFDGYLEDTRAFATRVQAECPIFPEGDLFPYLFPAFAYANDALKNPSHKEHSQKQMAKLLNLAIPAVVAKMKPLHGDLKNLKTYENNAVYLGQLNLALGCYRLIGGDDRFDALHRHISDLLHKALVEANGSPINSLPSLSWTVDTIPCLVSLKLYDQFIGKPRFDEIIRKHLDWVQKNATNEELGLPHTRISNETGEAKELPRGCDISMRLPLLANLDRAYAESLYKNYVKAYWLDLELAAGFAEWPNGKAKYEDIDSGPIFMGIGFSASGLGVAATIAMRDEKRLQRLLEQFAQREAMLALMMGMNPRLDGKKMLGGMIPFDPQYYTGFLFGDAILFYSTTWQPWVTEKAR